MNAPNPFPGYLPLRDAAERLGVTRRTAYELTRRGELPADYWEPEPLPRLFHDDAAAKAPQPTREDSSQLQAAQAFEPFSGSDSSTSDDELKSEPVAPAPPLIALPENGKTADPEMLERHGAAPLPTPRALHPDGDFACPDCEERFGTAAQLGGHRGSHTRRPMDLAVRNCQDCGAECKENTGLASHRRTQHGYRVRLPVQCPECGRAQRKEELEEHRRVVHFPNCPRCNGPLRRASDETVTGVCGRHGDVFIPKAEALAERGVPS